MDREYSLTVVVRPSPLSFVLDNVRFNYSIFAKTDKEAKERAEKMARKCQSANKGHKVKWRLTKKIAGDLD